MACRSVTFAGVRCKGYRLPTEAEWEYAARGGCTRRGGRERPHDTRSTWSKGNSAGRTHGVLDGSPANRAGLSGLLGTVSEWVWDLYGTRAYSSSRHQDPTGPIQGRERVVRGCSWADPESECVVTRRLKLAPDSRRNTIGLRVVRTTSRGGP